MALTLEQKELIVKLREEKQGYKAIAGTVGCTRDQVRSVCRRVGMLGCVKPESCIRKPKVCKWCGTEYVRTDNWTSTLYCSEECKVNERKRKKAEREKKALEDRTKVCVTCGNKFIRNSPAQKYCSKECSQEEKECMVCGKTFRTARSSNIKTCSRKCGGAIRKATHGEYYKAFSDIHRGMIVPTSMYKGSNYDMTAWCVVCQKETTRKAGQFLDKNRVRGCEHCRKTLSVGEDKIERWLIDNGIKYKKEYTFEDLKHEQLLRFDFGILNDEEELVALIEYDGIQHFKPRKQFGGVAFLLEQQRSDEMKNNYAKDNNIRLLRISYKEKHTIEKVLGSI